MNHNFFLTGFMGSGKSHWGKIWAIKNKLSYFDLDHEIEKAFGIPVTQIFEKHGEEKFREMEKLYLRKFEKKNNFLLSCGGGTPCFFDNQDWMKSKGKVIYLKSTPERLLQRVMDEVDQRPILKDANQSELLFFIEQKLKERSAFYEKADLIFDVETLDENSLATYITNATKINTTEQV